MKLTEIAAKLRKTAVNMEALAAKEGDLDFADEVVLGSLRSRISKELLFFTIRERPKLSRIENRGR